MNNQPTNPIDPHVDKDKSTLKPLEFGFEDDLKPDSLENIQRTAKQNAQARLVLIQLQWLLIVLMFGGILWLANNQKQLEIRINERLKVIEAFTTRMNNLDDRIFAMTPSEQKISSEDLAQNDLQLIRLQLASADRMYHSTDYKGATEMLQILQFNLQKDQLNLAVPVKSVLKTAIADDLKHIESLSRQTDSWQASIAKMREVQTFLKNAQNDSAYASDRATFNNASMLLSLAIGASAIKDKDTMMVYLGEVLTHLETTKSPTPNKESAIRPKKTQQEINQALENHAIETPEQAIFAVRELLANPPTLAALKSVRVLK